MARFMPCFDAQTALILVDIQNDFADPAGALAVSGGDAVVRAANELIEAAQAGGSTIVYTRDWHPERTAHFVTDGGPLAGALRRRLVGRAAARRPVRGCGAGRAERC